MLRVEQSLLKIDSIPGLMVDIKLCGEPNSIVRNRERRDTNDNREVSMTVCGVQILHSLISEDLRLRQTLERHLCVEICFCSSPEVR